MPYPRNIEPGRSTPCLWPLSPYSCVEHRVYDDDAWPTVTVLGKQRSQWHSIYYPAEAAQLRCLESWLYITTVYSRMVTHPTTNRAQRRATSLTFSTTLPWGQTKPPPYTWWREKDAICHCRSKMCRLRPMSHLQFYRAILSRNFIARQNRKCDMPCHALQLCRINKNWPISVHSIFATKLLRIDRRSDRKRSCATVKKLRDMPCHTCDFVAQ